MSLKERNSIEIHGSESRKVRKPLMEKKRRARINQSLNDLKRMLLVTDNAKKEGSRSTKLEKADILELTVNYVQKLHQDRGTVRTSNDDRCTGCSIVRSSGGSANNFRAGFNECTRLIRKVLHDQSLQKIEGDITERVVNHLEEYLTKIDPSEMKRSPSPSQNDSCSSFEDKDTVMSSGSSIIDRASPANHRLCSTSEDTESQHSFTRYSPPNYTNQSTPTSLSPIDTSRWTCGFKSVPHYGSPVLTAGSWEKRQVGSSMLRESNKWEMTSDAHTMESWASCLPSQQFAPEIVQQQNIYNCISTMSQSQLHKSKVWRPW